MLSRLKTITAMQPSHPRLPHWMKTPLPTGRAYSRTKNLVIKGKLNTICVSGNCPNKGECWSAGTATFMILGDKCTRDCKFCQVNTLKPDDLDYDEPLRLANTIKLMKLKHCVITSVARDELPDGGAGIWETTIKTIKEVNPGITMEVLIPDFRRGTRVLDMIVDAGPEIISHNIETVRRLNPVIRSMSRYEHSLELLKYLSSKGARVKSGMMLGLGETAKEVCQAMDDLLKSGVKVLTLGQYLQPSVRHIKMVEFIRPEVFDLYRQKGLMKGFEIVESGPNVRSSYHSERHMQK
ncbi:MAG: lipoyl synthase [Bacteroidales bacterium]